MNKIIISGIDDSNTLAVVRNLGKHNLNLIVLIHGDYKSIDDVTISKSKYAKGRTHLVNSTKEAIFNWLKDKEDVNEKILLFPCSDLAALTFDYYYNELKEHFIISGFEGCPGKVLYLMDKLNQKKYAEKIGVQMAATSQLCLSKSDELSEIPFPCILKPEVSAVGQKGDIRICKDMRDYDEAIKGLRAAGYNEVVLQEFILKDYEVCAFGCILDEEYNITIGGCVKKIRECPKGGGGSMTYGRFIEEEFILEKVKKVLSYLYEDGYRGQYDIDFFVCDKCVYLNEINFRHSGNGFGLINNGVEAPYYYCMWATERHLPMNVIASPPVGNSIMHEINDLKNYKEYEMNFTDWIRDFCNTSAYSALSKDDIIGSIAVLSKRFKNLIRKFI